MFPLLFKIPIFGGIQVSTYGAFYLLALIVAVCWSVHEGRLAGHRPEFIWELSLYLILANLAGARLFYILVSWKRYQEHPADLLKFWEGGLAFYGGLLGAFLFGFFYLRRHHLGYFRMGDVFAPGLSLGHAIGRIGCLAAGCCYGRETTNRFFSIVFPPNPHSFAPAGVPLFPSQPLEALASLLIFFILVLVRRRKKFDGQVFLSYLFLYGLSRFVFDFFRNPASTDDLIPGLLPISQWISLGLILFAIIAGSKLFSSHRSL